MGLGGHDLGHRGLIGIEAAGDHAPEHVALGEDAEQPAVRAGDERGGDVARDHLARGVADRLFRPDRHQLLAGDDVLDSSFGHGPDCTPRPGFSPESGKTLTP